MTSSSSSSGTGVDTSVHIPELPLPFADSYPALAIQARAGRTGDGVAVRWPFDRLAGHQRDRTADAGRPAQSRVGCQEIAVEKFR